MYKRQVPNLVGKTEDEAKNITKDMKLGIQPMGEEASNQAKGTFPVTISYIVIPSE